MENKSFIYFATWDDVTRDMDATEELEYRRAIVAYALRGEDVAVTRYVRGCMAFVKHDIDTAIQNRAAYIERQRANGAKGGAPKGNRNAQKTTQNNPNNPVVEKTTQTSHNKDKDININKDKEEIINKEEKQPVHSFGKKQYGEFGCVLLTDQEFNGVVQKWERAGAEELIKILDLHIATKGVQYANHYPLLLSGWVVDAYRRKRAEEMQGGQPVSTAVARRDAQAREQRERESKERDAEHDKMLRKAAKVDPAEMRRLGIRDVSVYLEYKAKNG